MSAHTPSGQQGLSTRRLAVGINGTPSRMCVSLYDVENNFDTGVDLYFRDVDDLVETLQAVIAKAEGGREWFDKEIKAEKQP